MGSGKETSFWIGVPGWGKRGKKKGGKQTSGGSLFQKK